MKRLASAMSSVLLVLIIGCQHLPGSFGDLVTQKSSTTTEEQGPLAYEMIGNHVGFHGTVPIKVEGIGLVVGLAGTGSNPPPNQYRTLMLDIMRKKETFNAQKQLASDRTSIVLLRGFVPPGARKGDTIDMEVWVPPGDETTSLKGGYLLEADLYVKVIGGNKALSGDKLVRAKGPVLVMEDSTKQGQAEQETITAKRGRILGQGHVIADHDFHIGIARDKRSVRRSKMIAERVNQRFHPNKNVRYESIAKAKTDKLIELKLAEPYRYDIQRFLLVTQRIPISSLKSFELRMLEILEQLLNKPSLAIEAALRLEAIGKVSIPILKRGLESDSEIVRFSSAQALAYLGDSSGAKELGRLAEFSNTYRVYALTALTALDHPVARMELGRLLQVSSAEARYGAFRARWISSPNDPQMRGEKLPGDVFLHAVATIDEPMVHASRNFRQEIVLLGDQQLLLTPLFLKAGDFITLNDIPAVSTQEGRHIHLASIRPGPNGVIRGYAQTSLRLSDVIRKTAEMGASYADIVSMLQQASVNGNLEGRLEVDALPKVTRLESLSAIAASEEAVGSFRDLPAAEPSIFAVLIGENNRRAGILREPAFGASKNSSDASAANSTNLNGKRPRLGLFRRWAN